MNLAAGKGRGTKYTRSTIRSGFVVLSVLVLHGTADRRPLEGYGSGFVVEIVNWTTQTKGPHKFNVNNDEYRTPKNTANT